MSPDDAALWSRAMQSDAKPLRDRAQWLEPARFRLATSHPTGMRYGFAGHETPSGPAPKGPLGIDGAMEKRLRRGAVEVDATLDLHGETQTRAHEQLIRFLSVAEADRPARHSGHHGKGRAAKARRISMRIGEPAEAAACFGRWCPNG